MAKSKPAPQGEPTHTLEPEERVSAPPTSPLQLRRAIFIYEEQVAKPRHSWQGRPIPERAITVCDVLDQHGTLGTPKFVDPVAFADAILDAHHQDDRETLVYQPDQILASGRSAIVWWRPAGPAKLYFKLAEGNKDEPRYTALNGREIPLPALLFRGSTNGGLMVWALAENKRPTPETKLYGAPFMNIHGTGPNVCLGSARSADLRDATRRASAPAEWERVFFESNFTHTPPALAYNDLCQDYPTLLETLAELHAVAPSFLDALQWVPLLRPCGRYPTLADAIAGKPRA